MSGSVLLAIALGVKLFQTYFTKRTSIALKTEREIVAFTAWRYLLCVLLALLLLLFEGGPSLSPAALGIAALGGVSLALCGVFEYVALRHGAVVLVQLAGMSGMLIPCVAGNWLFHEPFTHRHLLGVLLLGVAAVLLAGYHRSQAKKSSFLVWGCLLVVLVTNGLVMLSQKLFSVWLPEEPVSLYSFWTFAIASAVLCCILPLIPPGGTKTRLLPGKSTLPALVILAAAVFLISQLVTSASAVLPSVVIFPAFNGLGLVLATLLSAICFQERLTLRSVLGMLLGIGALLLMQ